MLTTTVFCGAAALGVGCFSCAAPGAGAGAPAGTGAAGAQVAGAVTAAPQRHASSSFQAVIILQQNRPLTQQAISACSDLRTTVQWGRSDLKYTNGDLIVSGKDQAGQTYAAIKGTSLTGCQIWSADLDGNGQRDLLILTPGQDSSGGYDTELSVLLFDTDGRPFPWKATGNFTSNGAGIRQLVQAPSGRGASVIVPTKEGLAGPDASLAFQAYTFSPNAVTKMTGSAFGLNWPVLANSTPELEKHQMAATLSFDQKSLPAPVRLRAGSAQNDSALLVLALNNGQQVEAPATLVEEDAAGDRVITFDPMPSDLQRLLRQSAQITTMGRSCEEEECRPLVMIARP